MKYDVRGIEDVRNGYVYLERCAHYGEVIMGYPSSTAFDPNCAQPYMSWRTAFEDAGGKQLYTLQYNPVNIALTEPQVYCLMKDGCDAAFVRLEKYNTLEDALKAMLDMGELVLSECQEWVFKNITENICGLLTTEEGRAKIERAREEIRAYVQKHAANISLKDSTNG
jgi:hypothetical protein